MNVTTPHSPRECRPDDPGLNFQLTPQTSPHLPTDSVGPLDPGQKGMLMLTDQVATSGAPTDPTKGLTTKRSTHPSVVESRLTDDARKSRPSDVKTGRADVSEGRQLEQAVVNYDSQGRNRTIVIDLNSGYETLTSDLIQAALARIQSSAPKDHFSLRHNFLQLDSCKSLAAQGVDSRTILTLRHKALRSPVAGGGPKKGKKSGKAETVVTKKPTCQDFLFGNCARNPCKFVHSDQSSAAVSSVLSLPAGPLHSESSSGNGGSAAQILTRRPTPNYHALVLTQPTSNGRWNQPPAMLTRARKAASATPQYFSLGDEERISDSDDEPAVARVDTTLRRGHLPIQGNQAEFNSTTDQTSLWPTLPASHASNLSQVTTQSSEASARSSDSIQSAAQSNPTTTRTSNLNRVTTQSSNGGAMQTDLSGYVTRDDFEALQHTLHLLTARLLGSNPTSASPSGRTLSPQRHETLTSETSASRSSSSQDRVPPDCLRGTSLSPRGSPSRSPRRDAWTEGGAASVNAVRPVARPQTSLPSISSTTRLVVEKTRTTSPSGSDTATPTVPQRRSSSSSSSSATMPLVSQPR